MIIPSVKKITQANIAVVIAAYAHNGQFRRDGVTRYFEHPKDVARRIFIKYDKNEIFKSVDRTLDDLLAVAYLHDVLEDTHIDRFVLQIQGVERHIIEAVEILTKTHDGDYQEYLKRVKDNYLACIVKIADMESNLNDNPTPKQIEKYTKGLEFLRGSTV